MANAPLDDVRLTPTTEGGIRLEIHAKPRASKTQVVGVHDGALSVAIAAPPVDGAANDEVIRFLAALFRVPKQHVTLVRGASARLKLLEVEGVTIEEARGAIARRR